MPKKSSRPYLSLRNLLRAPSGDFSLAQIKTDGMPGLGPDGRRQIPYFIRTLGKEMSDLQERLFASSRDVRGGMKVLVILEGLDTSGKGAAVRQLFTLFDPRGIQLKTFEAPMGEELDHDFLWRVRKELPAPGRIGLFERSHYEDVLVARVEELVSVHEWRRRYAEINRFESEIVASGTVVVKFFLHVSRKIQRKRLMHRLVDPSRRWRYQPFGEPSDEKWLAYMEAYADAIGRCNPDLAPWYIIPADRGWYRDWALAQVLHEHLSELEIGWPTTDFDAQMEMDRLRRLDD